MSDFLAKIKCKNNFFTTNTNKNTMS